MCLIAAARRCCVMLIMPQCPRHCPAFIHAHVSQWGLALLVPCTMAISLSCLPPAGAYTASQAIFYLSLAAKGLAGMNAFTSSST